MDRDDIVWDDVSDDREGTEAVRAAADEQLCSGHGLPQPCDFCGQESWRRMLRPLLPTFSDEVDSP